MGVGDGQGGLACCGLWGRKESDMTEQLNWTEHSQLNPQMWSYAYRDLTVKLYAHLLIVWMASPNPAIVHGWTVIATTEKTPGSTSLTKWSCLTSPLKILLIPCSSLIQCAEMVRSHNPTVIRRNFNHSLRDILQYSWLVLFKIVKVMRNKRKVRSCPTWRGQKDIMS